MSGRASHEQAEVIAALAIGAAALAAATWLLVARDLFSPIFPVGAFVIYGPAAALVAWSAAGRFGWPNRVTLARLVLVSLVGGVLTDPPASEAAAWTSAAVSGVALTLDGVDGHLARRLNQESAFGARFDMEVDALLILLLSLLAWLLGKAAAWVLLIGLLRYLFVAAGWLWPVLSRPLFPSVRRKAVCAVQGIVLAVLLAPVVTPPLSSGLALAALAAIVYSFAADINWLVRRRA